MKIEDAKKKIDEMDRKVVTLETENSIIKGKISELDKKQKELLKNVQNSVDGIKFVEEIALNRRVSIKTKIESVITEALKNVYGCDYSIRFEYSIKNSRSAVDVFLVKKTKYGELKRTIDSEGDGNGGGVFDTVSLPMKLLVLLASKNADKILFTDEPGKHIDQERIHKFAKFIKEISDSLSVQIFMCSHHSAVADYADAVFDVSCDNLVDTVVKRFK